ncbi:hypothetical protein M422DRAFT_270336 [Sphaerobolus stellatus SS14]|uniref:Uncharacterized protein n=1 Tax=Sphaerobolus stellatus (strain SS14) TaxID=990650 RepID=A0A0C9USW8_SPHS4|nr:hypothetical protein M422DRAFT_270336 [Sphaerobolus stellatus SS14]
MTKFHFEGTSSASITPYDEDTDGAIAMQRSLPPEGSFVNASRNEDCVEFAFHCQCMSAELSDTPPTATRIDSAELDKAAVNANGIANPSGKPPKNATGKHHISLNEKIIKKQLT